MSEKLIKDSSDGEAEKISPEVQEVLLKIYIGQNIRPEGILQEEVKETEEARYLLSKGLIKENHWYLDQFLTTQEGSLIATALIRDKLEEREKDLEIKFKEIPKRALSFVIKNSSSFPPNNLVFPKDKESYRWSERAEDKILTDSRIWILRDKVFKALEELELCVETRSYVSTRGGELRELCYVLSPEVRDFLLNNFSVESSFEKKLVNLYSFLTSIIGILDSEDLDYVRQQFYESIKQHSLSEEEVATFIDEASKKGITSEYRGLLSKGKPFEIKDPLSFRIYLDKAIEPIINNLLEKGEARQIITTKRFPSFSETKAELRILDSEQLGQFYLMMNKFEYELRQFIKSKLGKDWLKILTNEFPEMVKHWKELEKKDEGYGIEPEEDIMNYASYEDYVNIIKKHKKIFSDNDEDFATIIIKLTDWYKHGRNPLMHCRTIDMQKFYTTKSAIQFLEQWMKRKKIIGRLQ